MKKLFLSIIICFMAILIVGCQKQDSNQLEKAKQASESLTFANTEVTEDFTLPTNGLNEAIITWQSNDEAIKIEGGKATVTRNTVDKNVNLTANVKVGTVTYTKVFKFTVPGVPVVKTDQSKIIEARANLKLTALEITDNFTLPTTGMNGATVTWVSDNAAIAINGADATVTRGNDDVAVKLTATIKVGAETTTKIFAVKVVKLATVKTVTVKFNVYIPNNTSVDPTIAIAGKLGGDLPEWNPAAAEGKATKVNSVLYTFEYQVNVNGELEIEYKWTRGDWEKVEQKADGTDLDNRKVKITTENDTFEITDVVAKWKDLDAPTAKTVTVKFNVSVPNNTPTDATVAIAGKFGGTHPEWAPDNAWGKATKVNNVLYTFEYTVDVLGKLDIEYKWTRGSWPLEEKKADNSGVDNRKFTLHDGQTEFVINNRVEKWADLDAPVAKEVTVKFTVTVPATTPADTVAIAGALGGNIPAWNPAATEGKATKVNDTTYTFEYKLNVLGEFEIQYKWTRGDWSFEELNDEGQSISNRVVKITDASDIFEITDTVIKWKE